MKNSKLDYSAPEAEVFVVRFEGAILSGYNINQASGIQKGTIRNSSNTVFGDWEDDE